MRELSIEKMEIVSGGCSFEDLAVLSTVFLTSLGMYVSTKDANWLIATGGATLAMFACM